MVRIITENTASKMITKELVNKAKAYQAEFIAYAGKHPHKSMMTAEQIAHKQGLWTSVKALLGEADKRGLLTVSPK